MKNPLVSVIVPTKNSAAFLEECLKSIKNQTYKDIELIVVDNNSTDKTKEIAKKYTKKVFNKGPERSAQRNFGAEKSKGKYLLFIDSDMELSKNVVRSCIEKVLKNEKIKGVIIPEESFGEGFWAECKKLEKSFYVGVDWMEAARFFERENFQKVGQYDEKMISGEDWDLSQRVKEEGELARIKDFIFHNEGKISLINTVKKKYYYSRDFVKYIKRNKNRSEFQNQTGVITRYLLYFKRPEQLIKSPLVGMGMLFMKTCEFGFGGLGYLTRKST